MFSKSKLAFVCTVVLTVLVNIPSYAQCAMCKATAESDAQGGGTIASGLNEGILYLMFFPYFMIAVVAFMWYRHNKKNKKEAAENN